MSLPSTSAAPVALRSATPPLQLLAEYRSSILGGTVISHLAHWRYLTRFRQLDPAVVSHKSIFRFYGAAWGCVYLGVLSAVTFAGRKSEMSI